MANSEKIKIVNQQLAPLIQQIQRHPLYRCIRSIEHLRTFMEYHVFAVYDFMCLLKELHRRIVSTCAPWFPPKDAYSAHLINRILVEEEGDLSEDGIHYLSHFEIYLTAMKRIGANVQPIQAFLNRLLRGEPLATAGTEAPMAAQHFMEVTFGFFEQEAYHLATAFVYGREAITPSLFTPLVRQLEKTFTEEDKASVSTLLYYLNRHIELDSADHLPSALQMLYNLVGEDDAKWQAVETTARHALQARLNFLTSIQAVIEASHKRLVSV